ncbi:MFS transporter [Ventosimonas gracilis]|uniref:MFS transporter n=1 Tax=Ventosimonas gracilis TaxID=1680762 RepID=A0A139SVM0_9GAMM|nr:MFS transporter [Ventosimonas gracilis]KXU38492.1 MFS transporter [Ventosimonas gracilis]
MSTPKRWGLQLLFGWMNLVLAVPSIYLMFGLPLVLRQHGWEGTEIGLLQLAALPAIFKFLFAMPVQRVRFGRGHFVHWLWLMSALLLAMYVAIGWQNLIAHKLPLFALTFLISIATTWLDIPVNALAVQWLPRSEQLRAGSIRSAALFIGAIVGGGVMVLVLSRWGWQAPFVIMGAALLGGCLPFAALRAQASLPVQDSATDNTPPAILADWASFFAQPGATQWTWMLLTSFPFIGAVWLFLKPLMLDQGMPLEQVAWTIGIAGGVTGALFSLIGGRLISVLGTARAIVLYLLAALAALVLLTVVVWAKLGAVWLTISALIVAASMGAISALMFGLTMFFTRRQRNASDYGLQSTIFTVARLVVPVAAGVMLDYLGQVGMLTGMSIGVLCALGLALRARHSVGATAQKVMARED